MKQFVVRLTNEKRKLREAIVSDLTTSSQLMRLALIEIKLDIAGPSWADRRVVKRTAWAHIAHGVQLRLLIRRTARALQCS